MSKEKRSYVTEGMFRGHDDLHRHRSDMHRLKSRVSAIKFGRVFKDREVKSKDSW